jgi:hypothetical protein
MNMGVEYGLPGRCSAVHADIETVNGRVRLRQASLKNVDQGIRIPFFFFRHCEPVRHMPFGKNQMMSCGHRVNVSYRPNGLVLRNNTGLHPGGAEPTAHIHFLPHPPETGRLRPSLPVSHWQVEISFLF